VQKWARIPALAYQRHPTVWDRIVLAAGWTWLYLLCSRVEPWLRLSAQGDVALLPAQWRVVTAALVLVLGLWRPLAGYAAFIVAVAYPLYLVSVYVMALALAVLVLFAPLMALYAERGILSLALLVLLTVPLAPLHLAPLVPLLIGLWWQGAGSWIGGGIAALWLKLSAALSGGSTDLWVLFGWRMRVGPLYERLHSANSLQTVALVLRPFGVDLAPLAPGAALLGEAAYPVSPGLYLLFNLLQVLAWAAAAFVVSAILDHLTVRWAGQNRAGARTALSLLAGLAVIWASFVALPAWLGLEGPRWLDPPWLVVQTVWLGAVAWTCDAFLRTLRRPVPFEAGGGAAFSRDRAGATEPESTEAPLRQPRQALGRARGGAVRSGSKRAGKQSADQAADIMIELD
jgi:hypothetical protein